MFICSNFIATVIVSPPLYYNNSLKEKLDSIPENYAFVFVGHWMQGNIGEDRKNVGLLVKAFYEIFKDHLWLIHQSWIKGKY